MRLNLWNLPKFCSVQKIENVNTIFGDALRITLNKELKQQQIELLKFYENVFGVNVCKYRYAPEIRKTYFYLLEN